MNDLSSWSALVDRSQERVDQLQFRPYQLEGIDFLRERKKAMLRDDPGLGKTPQAALAAEPPVLVACPKYLVTQWADWIRKYISDDVVAVTGNRWKKLKKLDERRAWTVINYETLVTHKEYIFKMTKGANSNGQEIWTYHGLNYPWTTVIYDESHHLRNRRATRSRMAARLATYVDNVYLLTATPIWKEVDDLWMQFHIMHPEVFRSYNEFLDLYCVTVAGMYERKVLGVKKSMLPELEELLNVMSVGRTYEQAGRALPPLIEQEIKIPFPKRIKQLYTQTRDYWVEEVQMGFHNYSQVLNALRQITAWDGKLDAARELIQEDLKDPTVVFCWYRDTAERMARKLGVPVIHGGLDVEERRKVALSGGHVVATISSLSEGIDLSHCRHVVFVEEHWPPGANHQALSRVRRERQGGDNEAPVIVHYMMTPDTIDTHIHAVAQRRQATIREVVEGALGI